MSVVPYDEKRIGPDEIIIRRINPDQHVIWDENKQTRRISTKAYNKSSTSTAGMSVDIESLMIEQNVTPKVFVTTPIYTGSVAFTAQSIRKINLWVGYDPIRNVAGIPDNPYHGEVWAKTQKKNFSDAEKTGLAKLASWYVKLPDVDLV